MKELDQLYRLHFGTAPDKTEEIHLAVSQRRYFRIFCGAESWIGTYSPDVRETVAFCTFSDHFLKLGIHVPEVFAVSDDKQFYLQSDLGETRVHELAVDRASEALDKPLLDLYRLAIEQLVKMQFEGDAGLDYSVAVPRPA